jgi:hypothetical protein
MGAGHFSDRAHRAVVQHTHLIFVMRLITAQELLNVWEDGHSSTSTRRALLLLAAMHPGARQDALASLSIGQRDAELLRLRQALWGPRMAAVAVCPACQERLDLAVDIRDLLSMANSAADSAANSDEAGARSQAGEISLTQGDFRVAFRIPTTEDVLAAEEEEDVEAARSLILERCVLAAEQVGAHVSALELPAEVVGGIAERMAEADPLADIQLKIDCPSCQHRWSAAFDIVSFLWKEIEAWARRILSEVHTLASAYGWREAEILAMSAVRRQSYLEMVGA